MVGRVSVVPAIKFQVCKLFDQDTKCAVLNIYNLNIISHNTLCASIQCAMALTGTKAVWIREQ